MFELIEKNNSRRSGKLLTKSGEVKTPFFMPIATKGAVKNITPEDLEKMGAEIILGNTYHLWLRPGDGLIKKAGGLHKFMDWKKSILTDSGGYQVFSLGERAVKKFGTNGVKITEEGVKFLDPIDGKTYFMSPEKSVDIQLNLGSDIIMVLDECPPYPCSYEKAKQSMELTIRWAKRCKTYFELSQKSESLSATEAGLKVKKSNGIQNTKDEIRNTVDRPLLFGIIQGSIYEDLRQECAKRLIEIGFDGYAIGGVAVGEPRKHLYEILQWVVPLLPDDKPRYLMGLGRPEELARAVEAGMDMFDCVIPTREGRHGRLFVWNNSVESVKAGLRLTGSDDKESFYSTINIGNEKFKEDFTAIDDQCDCETCQHYTKAYLNHLLKTNEPLFLKLASVHNLHFYLTLMRGLRN